MLESVIPRKHEALYIAEIGLNHNGDAALAGRMIEAAARAGADAVKFQVFVPELMNSRYTVDLLAGRPEGAGDEGILDFFRGFVLGEDAYRHLAGVARSHGVTFFASVFDLPSLELMEGLGAPLYKIASSEVTNWPLIEAIARTGKPAVMSTGMAAEDEIAGALAAFRRHSAAEVVLLHCVSLYPLPPAEVNAARIGTLSERFGCPVGFSDHSRDILAAVVAAARGARVFEKHFTIDRFHDCPDKEVSLAPDDFRRLIDAVEEAIPMVGSGAIPFGAAEGQVARAARRSLFARRTIERGAVIGADDLVALRPGTGIPVHRRDTVLGRRALREIPAGHLVRSEDLEHRQE